METVHWLSGKQYTSQNDPLPPCAARPFKGDVHSLPVSNACGRIFHCEARQEPANSPGLLCQTHVAEQVRESPREPRGDGAAGMAVPAQHQLDVLCLTGESKSVTKRYGENHVFGKSQRHQALIAEHPPQRQDLRPELRQ